MLLAEAEAVKSGAGLEVSPAEIAFAAQRLRACAAGLLAGLHMPDVAEVAHGDRSDVPLREIRGSDPRHAELAERAQAFELIALPMIKNAPDPYAEMSMLMTAAMVFAGTTFGKLIVAGVATDGDKRRTVEAMAKNFRTGIDIGKRAAMRAVVAGCEGEA